MNFYETVRAAVADLAEHGFDSIDRVNRWVEAIRAAARTSLISERVLEEQLRATLGAIYRREITNGGILKMHPGVGRFTLAQVAPRLYTELERRMAMNRDLIVLNREAAMEKTERRFRGWASSVPAGGSKSVDRRDEVASVRKSLASLPYEERRLAIDQGHKFLSSLSAVVAEGGEAIAAIWKSHFLQRNYDYRERHKEFDPDSHSGRNDQVRLIRGSWALEQGLIKPGPAGYTDEIEQPGELVYCRCRYLYLYHLRQLPAEMLTRKGTAEMQRVRAELRAA